MTDPAMLEELLRDVAAEHQAAFTDDYRDLAQLPAADCDLQVFLDRYLQLLTRLYAATAGAVWFRASDSNALTSKSLVGFDQLGLEGESAEAHKELLQYALSRTQSFLVKPCARPHA